MTESCHVCAAKYTMATRMTGSDLAHRRRMRRQVEPGHDGDWTSRRALLSFQTPLPPGAEGSLRAGRPPQGDHRVYRCARARLKASARTGRGSVARRRERRARASVTQCGRTGACRAAAPCRSARTRGTSSTSAVERLAVEPDRRPGSSSRRASLLEISKLAASSAGRCTVSPSARVDASAMSSGTSPRLWIASKRASAASAASPPWKRRDELARERPLRLVRMAPRIELARPAAAGSSRPSASSGMLISRPNISSGSSVTPT